MDSIATIEPETPAKVKRSYHRKPAPPAPPAAAVPPAPPSAAVVALESDVLELVKQRTAANQEIASATMQAAQANARMQAAQQHLQSLENEVRYRLNLIQQMKGGAPVYEGNTVRLNLPPMGSYPLEVESGFGVNIPAGVGSIPAPTPQRIVQTGPRIRSESAEGFRSEEIGVRAAI